MLNQLKTLLGKKPAGPAPLQAEQLSRLGKINGNLLSGKPDQACDDLAVLLEESSGHPSVQLANGDYLRAVGKSEDARHAYEKSARLNPLSGVASVRIGDLLMEQKSWKEAERAYAAACRREPKKPEYHVKRGHAIKAQGWYLQASRAYRQAIRVDMDHVDAHHNLGLSCMKAGEYSQASKAFKFALGLKPELLGTWKNLALAYHKQKRYKQVIQTLESARKANPKDVAIVKYLAWMLREQQQPEASFKVLEDLLVSHTEQIENDQEYWLDRVRSLQQCRQTLAAISECERLSSRTGPVPEVSRLLAVLYTEAHRHQQAVEVLTELTLTCPDDVGAWVDLAVSCACSGDENSALSAFDKARQLQPDNAEALFQRVRVVHESASAPAMIDYCQARLEQNNLKRFEVIRLNFVVAMLQHRAGETDKATAHLQVANAAKYELVAERRQDLPLVSEDWTGGGLELPEDTIEALKNSNASAPLFLVGLPGSGRAYLGNLLSRNPEIVLSPEQGYLSGELERLAFQRETSGSLSALALNRALEKGMSARICERREQVSLHCQRPRYLLDCSDGVERRVAELCTLFNEARFVFLRRNPEVQAAALWHRFYPDTHPWSHHPERLVSHIAEYDKLTEKWLECFPEHVMLIDYEALVEEPGKAVKQICDWLGVYEDTTAPGPIDHLAYHPWRFSCSDSPNIASQWSAYATQFIRDK